MGVSSGWRLMVLGERRNEFALVAANNQSASNPPVRRSSHSIKSSAVHVPCRPGYRLPKVIPPGWSSRSRRWGKEGKCNPDLRLASVPRAGPPPCGGMGHAGGQATRACRSATADVLCSAGVDASPRDRLATGHERNLASPRMSRESRLALSSQRDGLAGPQASSLLLTTFESLPIWRFA